MVTDKGLWCCWCSMLWLFLLLLTDRVLSSQHHNKPCTSHCGVITNISHPFRLPDDPPHCGHRNYQLACENNVTLLHLNSSTYRVLGINYNNFTIRLVDAGIQKPNCSSLPLYSLSLSNFTTCGSPNSYDSDGINFYRACTLNRDGEKSMLFKHVGYLTCSDPVRDDAGYVDTDACVNWESEGGGGGHVYAVAGDLLADRFKPQCRLKSVTLIASDWGSMVPGGRIKSYSDIHALISYGFELSWWQQACDDLHCPNDNCFFSNETQSPQCEAQDFRGPKPPPKLLLLGEDYIHGIKEGLLQVVETDSDFYFGESPYNAYQLGKITGRFVLPFIIARFFLGIIFLTALLTYTFRRRHLSMYENIEDFIRLQNLVPIRYSYKDLKTITEGFKHKLGEGGFGTVYKGKLKSGIEVAVKILGNTKANGQEFINEVATIGRIHHFNVVHLIGFCLEGTKRALIYEFMPNGSLDKHIFSKNGSICLSYQRIYEISLGIAHGIAYLHHGCDMQILHFDIKPYNILLDDNFTPKISDFGLAKLYPVDNSIVTLTVARGTIGYMAPELFYNNIGGVSYKADVYSFGMLLLEMASRRRNSNRHVEHSSQLYFPSWIYDQFDEETIIEMEDLTETEKNLAKKIFIVALWCTQLKPVDRPSMSKIIEMLETDNFESLDMAPKPSLYPDEEVLVDDGSFSSQTTTTFSIRSHSNNSGEGTSGK